MAIKPRVWFLWIEISNRTRIAEAFLCEPAGDELEIVASRSRG